MGDRRNKRAGAEVRGAGRHRIAALLTAVLAGTLGLLAGAPPSDAAAVHVHPATAAETAALEAAANATHGCGFSSAADYLWPAEVASNGWALGQVDARNPADQGNGDLVLRRVGRRWVYVTCGSSFEGTATRYPTAVVQQLQRAIPVVRGLPAGAAVTRAVVATTPPGWCAAPAPAGPVSARDTVEITNVGGYASLFAPAPGKRTAGCVIFYLQSGGRWHPLIHATAPGAWSTARNVPVPVLVALQSATYRSLHLAGS